MSSRAEILKNIKKHTHEQYDMPEIAINGIQYADKVDQFVQTSKAVGGDAIFLDENEDINEKIKALYPEAKNIASSLAEVSIATISPDNVNQPHELQNVDLGVIEGELGVAENGCVWIPQNVKERAIYFIAEYLVIVLDRKKILNNMHEAYKQLPFDQESFGIFISGPSKTADIEQALVVGAHGAKGVTVILK